ncbi:MAG TPA: CHRD domain-containing protein [Candidatus Dormibacteraeota bacterium]|nr:CHRD domain-containing protein [Candidatus Dormibacteraeota bacterium]
MRALRIMMVLPVMGLGLAASPVLAAPAAASPYHAALSAADEVPSPGPPGGTGTAKLTLDEVTGEVCYDLTWNGPVAAPPPNAAHIHKGGKGTSGPIVVLLSATTAHTCTSVPAAVIQGIASDPNGYYVNIHNDRYPGGAVRGQLAAG